MTEELKDLRGTNVTKKEENKKTIEQKLKERFGVLYSEDGSVSYRSKLKPNYGSNEKLRPRKGDY